MSKRQPDDARVWRALSDSTRRQILDALRDGRETTGDLCAMFPDLGRTTVMKHLDLLASAGLVVVRREGRLRWNHLNPVPIEQIYRRWIRPYVEMKARALVGLKQHVEGKKGSKKR